MTYQSRNSIRVTQAPHPELEVSQVTFSVKGQSQRDDRDNVSCLRPVVDEDGRRHVTLSFSCADEDRPNVILESCNSLGVDVHQKNTSSVSLITNHTTASRSSPGHYLPSSTGRSRVDFIDKSDAVDLPFVSTSREIQNPPFGDNKLSRVNNTGKPCEHLTTEQTHSGRGVAEYCVLQTHDQDAHTKDFSSHAKASASCRLHSASGGESIGHKYTQPVHHRRANLSPQFKTRTIIKPFPVYGSTETEITHLSRTPPTNRDNVNRVGFSSPSRNVETKYWVASGQSKDNNSSDSEYTVSSSPIQVSIGGLGLRQCEESVFEDSRENITGYNETRHESKQLRVPTVLTITPSSSKVREFGDQRKTLTFVKELDKGANNVGITELRISSSCASRSLGDRSLHNMDSTNNNSRDGSNLVNCMDGTGQNQDNHGLQASRIFKPIKHDESVGRCEDNDTRLSAPERPVSSSSSAPTTPSFPKPFVPHGYDIARQQFSQHDRNSSPQGIGSRAEEVSSMARTTYKNSNSKSGQTEISGASGRLGFGTITTVASLKPLGVTKLAKVSKKSLQSFEDFTPTSSPTASRRSSVSSQDLSDATNEVKVLLARDVSVGDTAGHSVRVSAVQLPRKTTLNLRQSSVETDTRVSPMENSKKLFIGSETGEMKNLVGLRTDFSEFRLQGARVSPRNSPKSFIRTHTISAPSSPVRSLQDLTMKMKETPSASPLLSPRDKRPFSPMSEPAEDQGCVPDIQDELEHPGCSQTLPRNFHRRRPKTAPSVPTALLREVSNVGKELKDRVSTSSHRDASSPLKFSFQPINVKIKEDTESDSDRTILSHAKSKTISVKKRKKPSYSGQSTDSSESNGESNGRSRSDPTQDRKRSGETGEAVFENLQESQKGHSSSSIVSAESALSISSINTTLSDPNGEETFTDAYEEVLREADGPIADSLDQAKNVGKSQFKQKSLTWPNGEKSENELAEYCADKINMASSAPEVSGIEEKSSDDSSQHPKSRSPVLMPKQKSLTDSPKRTDSFSDSSLDSVRHKRSTSEPAPVDLSKSRADCGSDRQLPTLTVTTSQELGPTQRRFERKKPIIGSFPANQFLQPEPLEDQPTTTGSTPDLSHNSKNSRLESLIHSRSSATLPRAAASSKSEELSPKTKQKRKKENLKQHVMTTLLETEKSYVQCLESLIKRYQRPLKSAEFTGICDAGIVDSIFYKIPEILQNHENFLQQLEMGIENKHTVQKIANLITNSFSKQPVLDAYTAFTNNFDHAKELIGKASQKLGFIRFLEERTKEHKERLHIDDLIIQPVQRIPRYELLLKDLIDNTPPDHEDFESLNMALDTVRKLATAVNESKNLADNARKDEQALKELEGLIDGVDLVSPHRKFVRQYAITEMVSCC
ncbi:Rho guanine nucleotide exchange factor 17 [Holothuria leucospilota]|uniref:Rho guanine nucleotide exchange factor 17 n=1 Tax=Holothuria leucospilota TaxID=206669 RepID=A0A9Q1H0I0_HOLLE|nr:Rho guanine nucleotide exchange factor 17 [Holothuria leucospilota]